MATQPSIDTETEPTRTTMLLLPPDAHRRISHHAVTVAPDECCGILMGRTNDGIIAVEQTIPTTNISNEDRRSRYEVDPRTLFHALRLQDRDVVGFYHSHTDGTAAPSATDARAAWPDRVYLIVGVAGRTVRAARAWRIADATGNMAEILLG